MSVISVQTKKFGDLDTILTAGDDSLLLSMMVRESRLSPRRTSKRI